MVNPWNCRHCGEPNSGEACARCMTRALPDAGAFHEPGSYWAILHGYRGLYALPRGVAGILLLLYFWTFGLLAMLEANLTPSLFR